MQLTFRITNNSQGTITVVREPWGDWFDLPEGQILRVTATGLSGKTIADMLELVVKAGRLEVYGWTGSIVEMSVEAP